MPEWIPQLNTEQQPKIPYNEEKSINSLFLRLKRESVDRAEKNLIVRLSNILKNYINLIYHVPLGEIENFLKEASPNTLLEIPDKDFSKVPNIGPEIFKYFKQIKNKLTESKEEIQTKPDIIPKEDFIVPYFDEPTLGSLFDRLGKEAIDSIERAKLTWLKNRIKKYLLFDRKLLEAGRNVDISFEESLKPSILLEISEKNFRHVPGVGDFLVGMLKSVQEKLSQIETNTTAEGKE